MTNAREDAMEQRLRWMTENLNGAYNARHPEGHPNAGGHCTNSGTCIIVCCYINALGKVLLKGGPPKKGPSRHPRPDFARFQAFLQHCMKDFLSESSAMDLSPTPRGESGGDEWLYEVFRCGFIHGYPGANVAWGRNSAHNKYWFHHRGRLRSTLMSWSGASIVGLWNSGDWQIPILNCDLDSWSTLLPKLLPNDLLGGTWLNIASNQQGTYLCQGSTSWSVMNEAPHVGLAVRRLGLWADS